MELKPYIPEATYLDKGELVNGILLIRAPKCRLDNEETISLLYVYSEECHHCLTLKPTMLEFIKFLCKERPDVNIFAIRADNPRQREIIDDNRMIQGFPMIFRLEGRKIKSTFNSDRTLDRLKEFIKRVS